MLLKVALCQFIDDLPSMPKDDFEFIPDGFLPDLDDSHFPDKYDGDLRFEMDYFLNTTSEQVIDFMRLARVDVDITNKNVTYHQGHLFLDETIKPMLIQMIEDGEFSGNFSFLQKLHDHMHTFDMPLFMFHMLGATMNVPEDFRQPDIIKALVDFNIPKYIRVPKIFPSMNTGSEEDG